MIKEKHTELDSFEERYKGKITKNRVNLSL